MAYKGSLTLSDCELDSDFEYVGGFGPGEESYKLSSGTNVVQKYPEVFEMETLAEAPGLPGRSSQTVHSPRRNGRADPSAKADYSFNNINKAQSDLQGLSEGDAVRKLQAMPISLQDKLKIRKHTFSSGAESSSFESSIPYFLCVSISRAGRHCTFKGFPIFSQLKLWHSPMKRLCARFGSGVLSYFLFLRTLLFMNLLLVIITGLFLVLPQAIHPQAASPENVSTFTGLDLLTGTGYIAQSLMFYGYYSSSDQLGFTATQAVPYSIQTAYFFTVAICFFITCILLVYSMSKSFGERFHVLQSNANLAEKVFCSWDFKVTKKSSVRLQSEKISTQLKEQLSELICGEEKKTCKQRCYSLTINAFAWLVCLNCIFLSALGVYFLSAHTRRSDYEGVGLLLLPAVVSGFNLLLPAIFNLCARMEKHHSFVTHVYVSIFRNLLLKISFISVLCYQWLGKTAAEPDRRPSQCWEDTVGQEIYQLLLMDFIFTVLYSVLGEFSWRLFSKKVLKKNRKPVFDIARNVLELIYGQTLTWLGVLFVPLLPAVQILKLFLLFYMKKSSLMLNCQASRKPWRASQMSTLFITLLGFPSFLGAAISVVYVIWMIKPSATCGPFRNLTEIFRAGQQWADKVKDSHPVLSGLSWIYNSLMDNPLFLFLPSSIFLLMIYFHAQVVDGQRKIISQLEKQIENEGKDKRFLITQLQHLNEQIGLDSTQRKSRAMKSLQIEEFYSPSDL